MRTQSWVDFQVNKKKDGKIMNTIYSPFEQIRKNIGKLVNPGKLYMLENCPSEKKIAN